MASQVLSGSGSVSYSNNTGQNVRVVINYMKSTQGITINWAGASASAPNAIAIGRNLAFYIGAGADTPTTTGTLNIVANNMAIYESGDAQRANEALPTEIMLASGQSFSASCNGYNIVVIPEGG